MANVYELDAELDSGARENRFRVDLTLPNGVPGDKRKLDLLITSTSIPGKTKGTINIQKNGETARIQGDSLSDESFSVTFKIPKDAKKVYNSLFEWYKLKENYKTKVKMVQLDINNETIAEFEISGAWLQTIAPLTLNNESMDTIGSCEATFVLDTVELL